MIASLKVIQVIQEKQKWALPAKCESEDKPSPWSTPCPSSGIMSKAPPVWPPYPDAPPTAVKKTKASAPNTKTS